MYVSSLDLTQLELNVQSQGIIILQNIKSYYFWYYMWWSRSLIFYCFCHTAHKKPTQILGFEGFEGAAYVGGTVNLTCKAIADYIWFKKFGKQVIEDGRRIYNHLPDSGQIATTILMIKNVSVEDAGIYTCLAEKQDDVDKIVHTLRVG